MSLAALPVFLHGTEEKSVHAGAGWHREDAVFPCRQPFRQCHGRRYHFKLRMAGKKRRHLLLIFSRVNGAGGVYQPAALFQQYSRRIEDGRLSGV